MTREQLREAGALQLRLEAIENMREDLDAHRQKHGDDSEVMLTAMYDDANITGDLPLPIIRWIEFVDDMEADARERLEVLGVKL